MCEPGGLPDNPHESLPEPPLPQQPRGPELPEQLGEHVHAVVPPAVPSLRHVSFETSDHAVPNHVPVFDLTAADEISRDSMGHLCSRLFPRQLPLCDHGVQGQRSAGREQRCHSSPPESSQQGQVEDKGRQGQDRVRHVEGSWSRPAGPETAGPPCHGNHVPMPAGRGSLSGANAHGRWEVCKECRLRLLYVPAFGAHAHYRQAGPLPADAKKAVEIMEERVAAGEPGAKEILNAKAAALQGAEDSLLRRLETVRSQEAQAMNKAESSKAKDGYPDSNPSTDAKAKDRLKERGAQPKKKPEPPQHVESDSESSGMSAVDEAKRIPKKSAKRQNAKDAELQEAQEKEDTWTKVNPPEPGA